MVINNFPSLSDHILVWIFGIIIPFLSGMQSDKLQGEIVFDSTSRRKLYVNNAIMLMISAGSILIAWAFHARSFSSMGLSTSINDSYTWKVLILIFSIAYTTDLIISKKRRNKDDEKEWFDHSSFLPEHKNELPAYILLCIAAGVFEEIIFRGFMVNYFLPDKDVTHIMFFIRIAAPAVLFSLAHYYQGWLSVAKICIFSLLLSWIYISAGSLLPNMILHFLVDLISGLAYMKKKKTVY